MGFFSLKAGEKAVEGGFKCLDNFINGKNNVALERAKMEHDLAVGGLAIVGGGILLYGLNCLVDKFIDNGGKAEAEFGFREAHAKFKIEGGKN